RKAFFQFQVAIVEIPPEVFSKAEVNQREPKSRPPIVDQIANRYPSSHEIAQRTEDSTIQEPEGCVVPLVVADRGMVNIVSQADDALISIRNRWNLNQGNSATDDQVSQERNVQLQRWYVCIRCRLTNSQQPANLPE